MAESLRQAPAERPDLSKLARTNLAAWQDRTARLRAISNIAARLVAWRFDTTVRRS